MIFYKCIRFVVAIFALAVIAGCEAVATCSEISEYSFAPAVAEVFLENGESAEIAFEFYPQKERKMTFHTSPEDQFSLASSKPIQERHSFILPKRESPKESDIYSKNNPLALSFTVVRRDQTDGGVRLDFGWLGWIETAPGETVRIALYLYPAIGCILDSNDGFGSGNVILHLD